MAAALSAASYGALLAPDVGVINEKEAIMTTTTKLTYADLRHWTGTEDYFRHPLNRTVIYTEGAQYLAEQGGAYWLLDAIAIAQAHEPAVKRETFQV